MSIILLLLFALTEAEHVQLIAPALNGQIEYRLWDKTRVDILTSTHAWEVDWAPKWAEGIGQSLYYSAVTGKKPGLILLTKPGEDRFVYRAQTVCARHGITLRIRSINGP